MGEDVENSESNSEETSENEEEHNKMFFIYGVHINDVKSDIRKFVQPDAEEEAELSSEQTGNILLISGFWGVFILFLFLVGAMIVGVLQGNAGADMFIVTLIISGLSIILFPILWLTVTIVFSIFTVGAFFKRRHFSIVIVDRRNETFVSKLLMAVVMRGGVFNATTDDPEFDDWVRGALRLYSRVAYLRVTAVILAVIWGILEIDQRFDLLHLVYQVDLWPFRIIMLLLFLPLILYGDLLVWKIRGHYAEGDLIIYRLKASSSRFDPDVPLSDTMSDFSFG
ncbi:MAG: hypothetical protein K9W43_11035 [Candidatus Thorarchaeota archaeon]|nr:hypothetical protein [Candidatus Thorarchaeota archaeon]